MNKGIYPQALRFSSFSSIPTKYLSDRPEIMPCLLQPPSFQRLSIKLLHIWGRKDSCCSSWAISGRWQRPLRPLVIAHWSLPRSLRLRRQQLAITIMLAWVGLPRFDVFHPSIPMHIQTGSATTTRQEYVPPGGRSLVPLPIFLTRPKRRQCVVHRDSAQ